MVVDARELWVPPVYKLMVAYGEGRSPMTSLDAETDSKPAIIIIMLKSKVSTMQVHNILLEFIPLSAFH